jgi:hypothetical protein
VRPFPAFLLRVAAMRVLGSRGLLCSSVITRNLDQHVPTLSLEHLNLCLGLTKSYTPCYGHTYLLTYCRSFCETVGSD